MEEETKSRLVDSPVAPGQPSGETPPQEDVAPPIPNLPVTSALTELALAASDSADLESLCTTSSQLLQGLVPHAFLSLQLLVEESKLLRAVVVPSTGKYVCVGRSLPPSAPAWEVLRMRRRAAWDWGDVERQGPRAIAALGSDGIRVGCHVPLLTPRGFKGTLALYRCEDQPFTDLDLAHLELLAKPLATTVDNAVLEKERESAKKRLVEESAHLQLVLDVSNAIVSTTSMDAMLSTISRALQAHVHHAMLAFMLWDHEAGELRMEGAYFPEGNGVLVKGFVSPDSSPPLEAFERGEPLALTTAEFARFGSFIANLRRDENLGSGCFVPLHSSSGRLGVLAVNRRDDAAFTPKQIHLLTDVCAPLAIAIDNARAYARERKYRYEAAAQRDRLDLLLRVSSALTHAPHLKGALAAFSGTVAVALPHAAVAVLAWDESLRELRNVALHVPGSTGALPSRTTVPRDGPEWKAFHRDGPACVHEQEMRTAPGDGPLSAARIRSAAMVPLSSHGKRSGLLVVWRRDDMPLTAEQVSVLEQAAPIVSTAVSNLGAYRQLVVSKRNAERQQHYLEQELQTKHDLTHIVGAATGLKAVMGAVRTVAPTDATVLLLGETGTGKELLARAVHDQSLRRSKPFIRMNAAAIPEGLFESELFGHERGAFTGAISTKVGRLELAEGGTLFLDEIGDTPLAAQVKLLRVLQEREFERLGGTKTRHADVRVVAATHRDLQKMVAEGTFRQDLFYRLSVVPIMVPPLRERLDDIPWLVEHFVAQVSRELGVTPPTVTPADVATLHEWNWPGNVRELQNVIERAVILAADGALALAGRRSELGLVPQPVMEVSATGLAKDTVPEARRDTVAFTSFKDAEREAILRALRQSNGMVAGPNGAAARLQLKRTTLHSKMRKLGIVRKSY